ncbi:MAG: hypothetical protein HUJ63_04015 [Enterococcus sp.]|nr:hypothetical protein [Enterococcus sp.]
MKISISKNHIVVPVNTVKGVKNAVLDTGSGATFFREKEIREGEVDGVTFESVTLSLGSMLGSNDVNSLIGTHVQGMLGSSFFHAADMAIDLPGENLTMGAECPKGATKIRFNELMGLPIFDMQVNGKTVHTAFDTGNMYPFVKTLLVESFGLKDTGETIEDYSPILGNISAKVYKGDITLGDRTFKDCKIAASRTYDMAAGIAGVDAFLGLDPLKESVIWFSYKNSLMAIK